MELEQAADQFLSILYAAMILHNYRAGKQVFGH
jgi:hypothetical protein